jgi:hypothetical protein
MAKKLYKKMELGTDRWSVDLINVIKSFPHYATAMMWMTDINVDPTTTPYYQWMVQKVAEDGNLWGYIFTEEDILNRYNLFKDMFINYDVWKGDIDKEIELTVDHNGVYGYLPPNATGRFPVKVNGSGKVYLWDGNHRAAIIVAKGDLPKFFICERDDEWQKIIEGAEKLYPSHSLYQPIMHPDFQDWKISRPPDKERLLKEIFIKNGYTTVIDFGVCHAYALYELSDILTKGIGLEYDKDRFEICKAVLYACGKHVTCVYDDVVHFCNNNTFVPEVFLALAVFHHIMKENPKEVFDNLLEQMKAAKMLIYELPVKGEPQYEWMYEDIRDNIDDYIQEHTGFTSREYVKIPGRRSMVILTNKEIKTIEQ